MATLKSKNILSGASKLTSSFALLTYLLVISAHGLSESTNKLPASPSGDPQTTILDNDFLSTLHITSENNVGNSPEPPSDSETLDNYSDYSPAPSVILTGSDLNIIFDREIKEKTVDSNTQQTAREQSLLKAEHATLQLNQPPVVAEVAIIIDDLGYSRRQGLAAINILGNLTYAVIPHSPNAEYLAIAAHNKNKEVILHAPMSNIHNFPLGKSGLTEQMSKEDFHKTLSDALASVPYVSGVNNHMGSLLTQQQRPMDWTMEALKKQGLFFIDSRTTSQSVAWKTAQEFNIASLKRDVFLDHKRDSIFIAQQFERFISIAKRKGYAIAIGHPYPETIAYLEKNIGRLKAHGIELRAASELADSHSPNKQ